jgi:hypothetical protein
MERQGDQAERRKGSYVERFSGESGGAPFRANVTRTSSTYWKTSERKLSVRCLMAEALKKGYTEKESVMIRIKKEYCSSAEGAGAQELEEYSTAMKKRIYSLFVALMLWVAIFATAHPVQAALGESDDSVESDRKALSAMRGAITVYNGYAIHQVDSDSTIVREYVSATGIVFAVAWNGLVHPDLTQLLGSYADEYERGLEQTPREPGRRRLRVKTNEVVVEKWGHMRNLQGRAYVPALIPPGVSVDEIK